MCRILVHIHVGSVIAVEAIDRNRVDPVRAHVGEVHRETGAPGLPGDWLADVNLLKS